MTLKMRTASQRRIRQFAATLTLLALPALAVAAPQAAQIVKAAHTSAASGGAMASFKQRQSAVLKLVKSKASDKALQKELDKLLDYEKLAERSLGGDAHYAKNCADQCARFNDALAKLIRRNYLRMIRQATGEEIEYLGEIRGKKNPNVYLVKTKMTVTKEGVRQIVAVNYKMRKVTDRWVVSDIITNDVSLVKTYRYEFNRIMKKGGIAEVISKIEAKLKTLDKRDNQ